MKRGWRRWGKPSDSNVVPTSVKERRKEGGSCTAV